MKSNGTPTETLLDPAWRYEANPGFYDEALDKSNPVRPHWLALTEALTAMGHAGLAKRWQQGMRMIHDNGITYNVYSDPQSTARPWPLDPVPLVMEPGEWKNIEAAIVQRAMLFNAMLADLYGPQELLREHKLPAELVFPNPAFLRPCWGIEPPGGMFLHMYAADLARSPDGQLVGAVGPHADAFGRGLCARKPAGDHARSAGRFPQRARAAAGAVFSGVSRRAAAAGSGAARESAHRAADAGSV